ncbi:hypothetical protein [Nosocomiicoccus massiliensis]|uniref:hypothetical protein n=1 Tax=Nosocomiicoccus massiliensis TaxID=1232430 RepID=UPI00138B1389|nr:hypothetical protein [Nosocomiicoccus massiliensis]
MRIVGGSPGSPSIPVIVCENELSPTQPALSSATFYFTDGNNSIVGEKRDFREFADDSAIPDGE